MQALNLKQQPENKLLCPVVKREIVEKVPGSAVVKRLKSPTPKEVTH